MILIFQINTRQLIRPFGYSSVQPGKQPARQAARQADKQPGGQAARQAARQPGSHPGSKLGSQPGSQPGSKAASQAGRQPSSQLFIVFLFFVYETRKTGISKMDGIYHIIKKKANNKNVCYLTFMSRLFNMLINL